MGDLFFCISLGWISRLLISRDRLLGRVHAPTEQMDAGMTSTRYRIVSGKNCLDARLLRPVGAAKATILICHGVGETIDHWFQVQKLLVECEVTSLVFNYSGYGRSTGRIGAEQCEEDTVAAFRFLKELLGEGPVCVVGYSLGSGIAAAVAEEVGAERLVLCAAYTSLRQAAGRIGVPAILTRRLRNRWNTEAALCTCGLPVLIVQGEKDRLFPPWMARRLAEACSSECELVVVPGLSHNGPMYVPTLAYWSLIVSRLC